MAGIVGVVRRSSRDCGSNASTAADEPAGIQVPRVTRRDVDYADLIGVDETANRLFTGDITGEVYDVARLDHGT